MSQNAMSSVYLDEWGFSGQPTVAADWEAVRSARPLGRRSYNRDTGHRGVGALNPLTGQLTYLLRSKSTVSVLAQFLARIRDDYPTAEQIYVVEDNWPVHCHPT